MIRFLRIASSMFGAASVVLTMLAVATTSNAVRAADGKNFGLLLNCGRDPNTDKCNGNNCVTPKPTCNWTSPAQIDCSCQ